MIRVRTSSGLQAIASITVRATDGLKDIAKASFRDASALKRFFTASGTVAVAASPSFATGATAGFSTVTTNSVTVTATGGNEPYVYAWTLLSDDGGSWGAVSPASATTVFACGDVLDGEQFTATFRCTVTDTFGATGTVDVAANVINYGGIYP